MQFCTLAERRSKNVQQPFLIISSDVQNVQTVELFIASQKPHVIDHVEHKYCTVEKLSFPEYYIIQMVYSIIKFCFSVHFLKCLNSPL